MVSSSSSSHLSFSYPPIHTHPNLINSSLISSSYSPATPTSRIGLGLRRRPGFFPLVAATTACSNFTERESLYDVLGVSAGASGDEIKAAYRTLARIHHPDARKEGRESFPSGADEFMRIHAAYSTLSDPEKRAEYDRSLRPRRSIRPLGSNDDDCVSSFWRYPRRNWETDQCW